MIDLFWFIGMCVAFVIAVLVAIAWWHDYAKLEKKQIRGEQDIDTRNVETIDTLAKGLAQLAELAPNLYEILGNGYTKHYGTHYYESWDLDLIDNVWQSEDKDQYRKLAKKIKEKQF